MFQSVSDVVLLFKSLASAWGVFWGEVITNFLRNDLTHKHTFTCTANG